MPSTLVINDGSLAALVAAAAERDRGIDVVAWVPPPGLGLSEPGYACADALALVRHQASVLGYERTIAGHPTLSATPGEGSGIETTVLLLEAARIALAHGCARVVWPLALGDDLAAMAWAEERAELVTRLLLLDEESGRGRSVEIGTPVVDLSRDQIEDLAEDLGVPRHLAHDTAPAPARG